MKTLRMALILWVAFSWSNVMAQTQEQGHKHEHHEEMKEASPTNKGVTMKDEMKGKMNKKMKDMGCCPKEDQKEPKS